VIVPPDNVTEPETGIVPATFTVPDANVDVVRKVPAFKLKLPKRLSNLSIAASIVL